jgi:hypothetical protein
MATDCASLVPVEKCMTASECEDGGSFVVVIDFVIPSCELVPSCERLSPRDKFVLTEVCVMSVEETEWD